MSIHSNKFTLRLRDFGRKTGVNRILQSFILGKDYEGRYDRCLSSFINTGDCVWDVGANLGYYTKQFATKVGNVGRVYAFEPSPANFVRLQNNCDGFPGIDCLNIGLGTEDGHAFFCQGTDDDGSTSRVVKSETDNGTVIPIRSIESLMTTEHLKPPNVLKIDVEGFELEVLQGLGECIKISSLRAIGVEIHFAILKDRGCPEAAAAIESLLQKARFRVRWVDPSHIVASRG